MSGIISRKNEQFPKEFRAEIIFSEMDAASSVTPTDPFCYEEKEGLPAEAFAKVKEMFSNVDWLDSKSDAAYNMLQQIGASIIASEKSNSDSNSNVNSPQRGRMSPRTLWEEKLLAAFPGSPRSPTTMDLKTPVVPLDKSPSSKEAKPQDSKIEPFNQSDVSHQQNNQSVALAKAQPSQASSSVSSPASAVASSVASPSTPSDKEGHFTRQTPPAKSPPPKTPPAKEDPAVRVTSPGTPPSKTPPAKEDPAVRVTSPGTPPSKTPPVKENQTISGIPPEVSTSLKEVLTGLMTTPAAPVLPFASPLSKIEAGRDGTLVVPPPPATMLHFKENAASEPIPPLPSLPPLHSMQEASPTTTSSAPPPPPPPSPTAGASSNLVLALEESALDIDQVENLIKFCPTKEEMELLKGYTGDKDKLGKCEQFFLELMKVPRVESKLLVFSFKIQFRSQVSDLRRSLNIVNSTAEEASYTSFACILFYGTAFVIQPLTSHYVNFFLSGQKFCQIEENNADNSYVRKCFESGNCKGCFKFRTGIKEEMQAISKGLEKVVQELSSSENDGHVSDKFREKLKEFLCFAEAEVRSLASLYSGVGRNVDALILYFGEDPAKCSFEQVTSTLLNFVKMFNKAHDENCKQLEQEMKKSAENEKSQVNSLQNESKNILQNSIKSNNVK
ncbi:hypothetical protein V6N12_026152 [Hibiscus sabdariffa]|uniref:FH2 domain-containing protein n=1 Tax=Hibiscus sabdariffa TaxID=183260 RepID=A0ABR2DQZ1_9ROSI